MPPGVAAAQLEDPLQPLMHRLPLHVQLPRRLGRVAAGVQPSGQGAKQPGIALRVMIQERAQLLAHEVPPLVRVQAAHGKAFDGECLAIDHGTVRTLGSRMWLPQRARQFQGQPGLRQGPGGFRNPGGQRADGDERV